jgi:hypothetical protein
MVERGLRGVGESICAHATRLLGLATNQRDIEMSGSNAIHRLDRVAQNTRSHDPLHGSMEHSKPKRHELMPLGQIGSVNSELKIVVVGDVDVIYG